MATVGIIGGSGYTGGELLRLCAGHPELDVAWATGDSQAGTRVASLYPSLTAAYPSLAFEAYRPELAQGVDLVFLALPHGASQAIVPGLLDHGPKVVDLAADFRLLDTASYEQWYGEPHACPDILGRLAYGLPELNREAVAKADGVAAPGCYPTAATLALAPLVRAGLIEPQGIVVDAASGVSGAGRGLKHTTHFGTVNEDFVAYGLLDHRHTPEIEQAVAAFGQARGGVQVLFTPHLVPMTRGILATCYARPAAGAELSTGTLLEALAAAYETEPFVVVAEAPPSTKAAWGSNTAHLSARYDPRTGWVMALAAIDNLVKGASGQAVQCANLLLGLEERAGLASVGVYP
ncbi:MAG: N-acetyl-gamma-glutamyl-phosphate reductase [Actinomycetota bacterium]|jgi:N-acetyl-gamma-glutamyl-phosphate reductase